MCPKKEIMIYKYQKLDQDKLGEGEILWAAQVNI